jgi:hypothetical protein
MVGSAQQEEVYLEDITWQPESGWEAQPEAGTSSVPS